MDNAIGRDKDFQAGGTTTKLSIPQLSREKATWGPCLRV